MKTNSQKILDNIKKQEEQERINQTERMFIELLKAYGVNVQQSDELIAPDCIKKKIIDEILGEQE